MDTSKIRAFHIEEDSLEAYLGQGFTRFDLAEEQPGPFEVFEPEVVYVVNHRHPGHQMIRAFYRISPDGTDLEALHQVIYEGEVLADEWHMDLFGPDPIKGQPVVSIDCVLVETEGGSIYAIDGQLIAPVEDLRKQHLALAEVMESTARHASYLNGTFYTTPEAE